MTRLLNIPGARKFDFSRIVMPAAFVAIVSVIVGGGIYWYATSPQPSASGQLTEAINNSDLESLKYFAELDSTRAYVPYSELLIRQEDFTHAIEYAEKALSTPDSAKARTLLRTAHDSIAEHPRMNPVTLASNSPEKSMDVEDFHDETPHSDLAPIDFIDERQSPSPMPVPPMTPEIKPPSDDELFARASTIADLKALADRGYAKAYAPLAEKYFTSKNYNGANTYARKALSANIGKQQAISIVEKLDVIGYYDNGENGGKPKY